MMKIRRLIAFVLFSVYLFAVVGPSYASLSCRCVAMKSYALTRSCCHHCEHNQPVAGKSFDAPCCGNHHSTEINLYTGSSSDEVRYIRCAVCALPPSLATGCLASTDPLVTSEKVCERRAPFLKEAFRLSVGFRAPPVLA